jgi:hypothetical protein
MTTIVAASEHELIAMARALVTPHIARPTTLFRQDRQLAAQISPACAGLLEDALRQVWPALWRRGRVRGWTNHPPAQLAFTTATLQLVRWLVSAPLASASIAPLRAEPLSLGDQVVVYLALELADDPTIRAAIAAQPFVRACPLAWLAFAHLFTGEPPSFAELATGTGAIVVETLAHELARHWRTIEATKPAIDRPARLIALGAAQDATLDGFMTACNARRDLAAFVLEAAAPGLQRGVSPGPIRLDPTTTVSARHDARVAAGALLRAVVRWREWDDQHRAVRFIDDDFDRAQALLGTFEPIGRAGADRAAAWLAELSALAPTTA